MARQAEPDSKVSRRSFLGGAAGGVAVGALGGRSTASAQAPATQEIRTDVVVVGSGIGGLTAALRAQQRGARVVVLEKAYEPGGTTAHSEGGIADSKFEDMRANAPDGDPEVQRTIADNVPRFFDFMDSIGAPLGAPTGVSRTIAPVMWINFMVGTIESGGGRILVETPMVRLLTNRQNEVIGVLADGPKGLVRVFGRAVVLATGGWMNNAQMVQQHITRYFGSLRQRNASFYDRKPPFLGDGFFVATELGAAPSTGGFDAFYGHLMPAVPGKITNPMSNWSCYHGQWAVAVNTAGRRFTDEAQGKFSGRQMTRQGEQLTVQEVARQIDATAAYIWDAPIDRQYACEDCGLGGLDKFAAYKLAGAPTATADTLPELARQMEAWGRGMSAETVLRELTEYNQAAKNGKAWALPVPKSSAQHALPLVTPPFYAVLGQAGITATHGGLRVNSLGQVLARTGKPIAGLYAAGIDVGNFNNYVYLGNLCIGAGFGYASGGSAAKQPEPRGGWEVAPGVTG